MNIEWGTLHYLPYRVKVEGRGEVGGGGVGVTLGG